MSLIDFTVRITASVLFGFLIGIERQLTGHPAGVQTNVLVSLGSCIFVSFSMIMGVADTTRIAAQIVTGVGFLGSGIIFKDGVNVRGLNTSATIWCAAAIGVLISSGKILYAFIATVMIIMINIIFQQKTSTITPLFRLRRAKLQYKVSVTCTEDKVVLVRSIIINQISVSKLTLTDLKNGHITEDKVEITAKLVCRGKRKDDFVEKLVDSIINEQGVESAGWELVGN